MEVIFILSVFYKPAPQSKISIYSSRRYGEPRLPKPPELKGIKQAFSVDWIPKKCRCPCYIKEKDLWIKHRDFGSICLYGKDQEEFAEKHNIKFRNRFVYNDNFGCIVLRGEAWLLIKDLIIDIENEVFLPKIFRSLAEQLTGEIGVCHWERFFDKVIRECAYAI